MNFTNFFELKKLIHFDGFIELFSFAVFLDIVFLYFYSTGIFYFENWGVIFNINNTGKIAFLIIIYGMYRIAFSPLMCFCLYTCVYLALPIRKNNASPLNVDKIAINKAEEIAIDTNNSVLNEKINDFLQYKKSAMNVASTSVSTLLLVIIDLLLWCQNISSKTIIQIFFHKFEYLIFLILAIIFVCYLIVITYKGYFVFHDYELPCDIRQEKNNNL